MMMNDCERSGRAPFSKQLASTGSNLGGDNNDQSLVKLTFNCDEMQLVFVSYKAKSYGMKDILQVSPGAQRLELDQIQAVA